MKYEYVITDGPGTLIDYGVLNNFDDENLDVFKRAEAALLFHLSIHAEPCDDDCETGQ